MKPSNVRISTTASRIGEKAIATVQARFAIAGFAVHRLDDGGYIVLSSRNPARNCPDFDSLCAFARLVGVHQDGPVNVHAERAVRGEAE